MAKASKQTKSEPTGKKKPERKAPAGAAPAAKPLIDPATSAAAAAALVGRKIAPATPAQGSQTESTGFRNLKEALNKPHSQTMNSVLDKMSPGKSKTPGFPLGGGKQVGQNQTYGSDASRRNVPRRTGG